MTSQQLKLNLDLKPIDHDLIKTFKTLCKVDGKTEFSSDDFRMYGLDRFLRGSSAHAIGGFFARLIHNRVIRQVGWKRSSLPSNRLRKIRVYEWEGS